MITPEMVATAKEDFRYFVWVIFKNFLWDVMKDPTNIQYDIAAFLSKHLATHKVIMAFRGIGKSYIAALYCIWKLWKDPTLSILVISASKERSDQSSTFMLRILRDVPFLTHLDPEKDKRKGSRTSKLAFDVIGAGNKQSPSVRSAGIMGMITGSRADIILADDVEIPNNSDSPTKRSKLRSGIEEFEAIIRTGEGKQVIFLGTPQSQESIYVDLPQDGKWGYEVRIWPAEFPASAKEAMYYGKRLAPFIRAQYEKDPEAYHGNEVPTDFRFDEEELAKRRARYGKSGYALQFLLNTTMSDELKYPLKCRDFIFMDLDADMHPEKPVWGSGEDNMIRTQCQGFEGDAYFRPIQVVGEWGKYSGSVMTIDPSGRGADETAYAILKWGKGYLYLLDCGGVPGGFEQDALIMLAKLAAKWGVNAVVPERNMGGGMFGELLRPILRVHAPEAGIPPIEDLPFHTIQKETRIINCLEPVMNSHRLVVNRSIIESDLKTHEDIGEDYASQYQLFTQLTRLTRERGSLPHDDRLDALAMAVQWAQVALGQDPDALRRAANKARQDEELYGYLYKEPNVSRTWGGPMRPPAAPKSSGWINSDLMR